MIEITSLPVLAIGTTKRWHREHHAQCHPAAVGHHHMHRQCRSHLPPHHLQVPNMLTHIGIFHGAPRPLEAMKAAGCYLLLRELQAETRIQHWLFFHISVADLVERPMNQKGDVNGAKLEILRFPLHLLPP
jgi:hypothetical protein